MEFANGCDIGQCAATLMIVRVSKITNTNFSQKSRRIYRLS